MPAPMAAPPPVYKAAAPAQAPADPIKGKGKGGVHLTFIEVTEALIETESREFIASLVENLEELKFPAVGPHVLKNQEGWLEIAQRGRMPKGVGKGKRPYNSVPSGTYKGAFFNNGKNYKGKGLGVTEALVDQRYVVHEYPSRGLYDLDDFKPWFGDSIYNNGMRKGGYFGRQNLRVFQVPDWCTAGLSRFTAKIKGIERGMTMNNVLYAVVDAACALPLVFYIDWHWAEDGSEDGYTDGTGLVKFEHTDQLNRLMNVMHREGYRVLRFKSRIMADPTWLEPVIPNTFTREESYMGPRSRNCPRYSQFGELTAEARENDGYWNDPMNKDYTLTDNAATRPRS